MTQIYSGTSVHPTDQSFVLAGFQDNGSNLRSGSTWRSVYGADGGYTGLHPSQPSVMFIEWQDPANLYRSTNGGTSFSKVGTGISTSDRVAFLAAYEINPSNPQEMLYASQRVWRSTNQGTNFTAISADVTTGGTERIRTIQIARSNPQTVYIATSDGRIQVSLDGGATFTPKLTGLPRVYLLSREIDIAAADDRVAVIGVSAFGTDQVRITRDRGDTWKTIDGNLPDIPVNTTEITQIDGVEMILIGTDQGVFYTCNEGQSWQRLGTGIPNVVVTDIRHDAVFSRVVATTFGRGMWTVAQPTAAECGVDGGGTGGAGGSAGTGGGGGMGGLERYRGRGRHRRQRRRGWHRRRHRAEPAVSPEARERAVLVAAEALVVSTAAPAWVATAAWPERARPVARAEQREAPGAAAAAGAAGTAGGGGTGAQAAKLEAPERRAAPVRRALVAREAACDRGHGRDGAGGSGGTNTASSEGGCGCRTTPARPGPSVGVGLLAALALVGRRRRQEPLEGESTANTDSDLTLRSATRRYRRAAPRRIRRARRQLALAARRRRGVQNNIARARADYDTEIGPATADGAERIELDKGRDRGRMHRCRQCPETRAEIHFRVHRDDEPAGRVDDGMQRPYDPGDERGRNVLT